MTAAVTAGLVGGARVSGGVRFTDRAGASTVAAPTAIRIFVSLQTDRSNPRLLRGTSTVGLIYVFAGANARIRRVRFYLDDPGMEKRPTAIRTKAPFDLRGHTRAGDARPLDTTRLSGGVHSMTAAIELDNGAERVLRARWIVPRLYLSPSGQDAAPCTASAPCQTLDRAYGLARPGQVVELAPGDYGDQVVTGAKDAPGAVFDLQGAHLTSLELHASYVEFRNGRIDRYTWDQSGPSLPDHVTFRNISASGFYMDGGSNIRIIGGELGPNTCASTGYAYINWIWSDGSTPITNVLLDGVSIHDNHTCLEGEHYEAVRIDENAVGVTIRNSHFQRNSIFHVFITDSGFSEASVPRDITIENNTFDQPVDGTYAIKTQEPSVQTCTNYTIRGNRFATAGAIALTCPKKVNVLVSRNTVG